MVIFFIFLLSLCLHLSWLTSSTVPREVKGFKREDSDLLLMTGARRKNKVFSGEKCNRKIPPPQNPITRERNARRDNKNRAALWMPPDEQASTSKKNHSTKEVPHETCPSQNFMVSKGKMSCNKISFKYLKIQAEKKGISSIFRFCTNRKKLPLISLVGLDGWCIPGMSYWFVHNWLTWKWKVVQTMCCSSSVLLRGFMAKCCIYKEDSHMAGMPKPNLENN